MSTAAVLIGEETGKTKQRGLKRLVGCIPGFGIGLLLVCFQADRRIRILVFVSAQVVQCLTMPRYYIIGSMSIGLSAVMGNSLMESALRGELVMERFVWTVLGIVIAIASSSVIELIKDNHDISYAEEVLAKKSFDKLISPFSGFYDLFFCA